MRKKYVKPPMESYCAKSDDRNAYDKRRKK